MNDMKNLKKIFLAILATGVFAISCQEENPELGKMPDKSEVHFDVIQDPALHPNGNIVILRNTTPQTMSMWDYQTGSSFRQEDTVAFPFAGNYVVKFSAVTGAGIVEADPVTVNVPTSDTELLSDPLWALLAGGPGESKTWKLDIDAEYWDGPLYFYGTHIGWGPKCLPGGTDCWNWNPDYAGNTWLMADGDYGTMTFNLIDGAFVSVDHKMLPGRGVENGTYRIVPETKTLVMSNATPLHDSGRDGCVAEWGNIRLLSLTEDAMQFAVLRTSCEGPCLLVYNYVAVE